MLVACPLPPYRCGLVVQRERSFANGWSGQVIGVHRDCWTCGRTCELCHLQCVRKCRQCSTEYCVHHDDGCSANEVRCSGLSSSLRLTSRSALGAVTAEGLQENSSSSSLVHSTSTAVCRCLHMDCLTCPAQFPSRTRILQHDASYRPPPEHLSSLADVKVMKQFRLLHAPAFGERPFKETLRSPKRFPA